MKKMMMMIMKMMEEEIVESGTEWSLNLLYAHLHSHCNTHKIAYSEGKWAREREQESQREMIQKLRTFLSLSLFHPGFSFDRAKPRTPEAASVAKAM